MAIPFSSAAPVRLDELLQVPLTLIPLEEILRENSASALSGGNRQCHSADSPSTSSASSSKSDHHHHHHGGHFHTDKPRSLSSPCVFDCCMTPSRWKISGPVSNKAKFISQTVTLPDGTVAVIPVMDLSEETLSDVEVCPPGSDDIEEAPEGGQSPVTERNGRTRSIIETGSHVVGRNGESGRSSTSSISSTSAAPVVLGKVTDNPTRYEDLITDQSRPQSENNNNNLESSDRNVISVGGSITPPGDDQRTNGKDPISAENTLKLTFYNDGRKQSEKAFRTSEDGGNGAAGGSDSREPTPTHDSREYFENHHGLQLSRVLRGIDIDRKGDNANTPPPQRQTNNANNENTQDKPRQSLSLNNKNNSVGKTSWEQWNGLQISRCHKDSTEKVQNSEADAEAIPSNSPNADDDDREKNNSGNTTEKGESETLIEKHLQSVLTSLRYVRPHNTGPANASSSRANAEYPNQHQQNPVPSTSAMTPDNMKSTPSTGRPLLQAEVDRGGGVVRVSSQVRPSPGRPRASSISKVGPQSSPPMYQHRNSQSQQPQPHHSQYHPQKQPGSSAPSPSSSAASSSSSFPERSIARIPTRPYLLKNSTYELPPILPRGNPSGNQQAQAYAQQQHGLYPPVTPGPSSSSSSSLHSSPKRFKPANLAANPSPMNRQQPKQFHGLMPNINRYPNINNSMGAPSGNGSIGQYHQNSLQYSPQHVPSLPSTSGNRSSIMAYPGTGGNVQNNLQPSSAPPSYGALRSPSQSLTTLPYRSPQGGSETPRNAQNYQNANSPHPISDSMMFAAAIAANNNADHFENSDYYDRLGYYYEYYRNKQFDLEKLAEYQQRAKQFPSWDSPSASAQSEQLARQVRGQPPPQRSPDVGRGQIDANSLFQHHLALRAMEAAGTHRNSMITGPAQGLESFQMNRASAGRPNKILMNIPQSQTSPPSALQNMQGKYGPSPQQLQQLRQLQERQYQHQILQQEQLRYQAPNHIQARPRSLSDFQPQYPQQRLQEQQQQPPSQSQNRAPVIAPATPSAYDIQNTPQYRAAYDQLAAAASALVNNNNRPSVIDIVQNHLRTSLNNFNANAATPTNQAENSRYLRIQPKTNQHQQHSSPSGSASSTPLIMKSPGVYSIPNSTTTPTTIKEVPFMPNTHRQTLEHAIKNNFKSNVTDLTTTLHRDNNGGGTIVRNPRYINITPSPPPLTPPTQNSIQDWSTQAIEGDHPNMAKEPLITASSPTLAHQTLVIRRVQQAEQLSPAHPTSVLRKSPIISQPSMLIPNRIQIPILDSRISSSSSSAQQHLRNPPLYTNNLGHYNALLKRRINAITNRSSTPPLQDSSNHHHHHTELVERPHSSRVGTPSPTPLIVGQEEIVSTSLSPSSIPTSIIPVDNGEVEALERDDNERGQTINREERASPGNGGNWQYDHVVLLDNYIGEMLAEDVDHSRRAAESSKKRTKIYMCKRCFETLKTEQEIRNHLFCKMLAGYVRCHVCFQLLKSDNYPEHLQVHGVRPPEDED